MGLRREEGDFVIVRGTEEWTGRSGGYVIVRGTEEWTDDLWTAVR